MKKQNIKNKQPQQVQKNKLLYKEKKDKNTLIFILVSILVLTVIVFSNSIKNNFISNWDDDVYILNNIDIRDINFEKIGKIFTSFYNSNYHPLTTLFYAIEFKIFGQNAIPFHFSNLLLHLMNVSLVFYFSFLFTKKKEVSTIAALFFAIHPMHVESVSWISERKDVLYTFFFLGSMIYYLKYLKNETKLKPLVIAFVLFLLSCFSKSMAVTLPLVLILIDFYFSRKITKKVIIEKIPFIIVSLIFGYVAFLSQSQFGSTNMAPHFELVDRFFLISYGVMYYIVMFFVPMNLSAIHYYPVKTGGMLPLEYYLAPIALLLITWGVYKAKKLKKELIFGLLFYIVTISLVIQLVPIGRSIVSERYSYVPYLGLIFILGMFYNGIKENYFSQKINNLKNVINIILVVLTVYFCITSYLRNKVWIDGISLFTDVIEKYPDESHPYLARAGARMNVNDLQNAIIDYGDAIKRNIECAEAYNNRAVIKNIMKQYDAAIADCKDAIKYKPDYPDAYNNYGVALANSGLYNEAIECYKKAIKLNPKFFIAYDNRGFAKNILKDHKGALADCNIAISINPYYPEAYNDRGIAKQNLKDFKGAIEDYSKAIALNPGNIKAYSNRGLAKVNIKDYQTATYDFEKCIQLDSTVSDYYFNLGVAKYYLNDKNTACQNWHKAAQKGHAQAELVIRSYCR